MKVVYEAALFPAVGGGPRHFVGMSKGLRQIGVDVTRVLPGPSAVEVTTLVQVRKTSDDTGTPDKAIDL